VPFQAHGIAIGVDEREVVEASAEGFADPGDDGWRAVGLLDIDRENALIVEDGEREKGAGGVYEYGVL
jgi:hypothetical protein